MMKYISGISLTILTLMANTTSFASNDENNKQLEETLRQSLNITNEEMKKLHLLQVKNDNKLQKEEEEYLQKEIEKINLKEEETKKKLEEIKRISIIESVKKFDFSEIIKIINKEEETALHLYGDWCNTVKISFESKKQPKHNGLRPTPTVIQKEITKALSDESQKTEHTLTTSLVGTYSSFDMVIYTLDTLKKTLESKNIEFIPVENQKEYDFSYAIKGNKDAFLGSIGLKIKK